MLCESKWEGNPKKREYMKLIHFTVGQKLKQHCKATIVLDAKLCPTLLWPPQTVAHQVPLSTGFPRQEYWSVLPYPSPEDLPDSGIELVFPVPAGRFFTTDHEGGCKATILQLKKKKNKGTELFLLPFSLFLFTSFFLPVLSFYQLAYFTSSLETSVTPIVSLDPRGSPLGLEHGWALPR